MKVLVIGKGGREDAILTFLQKSKEIEKLYCLPGNANTQKKAENANISEMDNEKIVEFVKKEKIDYVVVTPDNPLSNGLVDDIEKIGVSCFGPNKKAAEIESSKIFAKNLMKKYNIKTADFEVFDNCEKALEYVNSLEKFPTVIKADGLAFGKGVIIANNKEEAKEAIIDMMQNEKFNESGKKIVIEEFLEGVEVSLLTFTDGKTIKPMVSSMDHKRALENDKGPNTGGMGVIAPNPFYTKEIAKICEEEILKPTINAMQKEGRPFKGCLYFGLMITKNGPYVIEYNCRFGDPETQAVLPLLKTDLFKIMKATSEGNLENLEIEFEEKSCACVVLTSKGYPEKYETGFEIRFNQEEEENVFIFHSGTKIENEKILTNGGRVIACSCVKDTLKEAIEKAYEVAEKIEFKNKFYRKDIGKKALNKPIYSNV